MIVMTAFILLYVRFDFGFVEEFFFEVDIKSSCLLFLLSLLCQYVKFWQNAGQNWNGKVDRTFDPAPALQITGLWLFCADNYLAPAYSDCYEKIDSVVKAIETKDWETWEKLVTKIKECHSLKQAEHFFADCKEDAGDGVDGLISYVNCARNLVLRHANNILPCI